MPARGSMPSGSAVIRYEGTRGTVYRVKYRDASGRQVMETLGRETDGWTKAKAERELRHRLTDVERKGWRKPEAVTFASYVEIWFEEGEKRRRWKPATARQYRSVKRRLVDYFGPMPLATVRPRHVAEFVANASADYGAATVSRDVSVLHTILESARREELIDGNPAARAERPKLPRRRWRILEPAEITAVASALKSRPLARVVFLTLVLTGLRRSELQNLRWRDVDLLEGVLRVQDSKSEEGIRAIALSPTLVQELSEHYRRTAYKGDGQLVFCHPECGGRYKAETFKAALDEALEAVGITDRLRAFHDLRHSAITHDAASGSSAIAVMAKAGHRNMATTRTYLHLAGVVFREEAERLEQRLLGPNFLPDLLPDSADLSAPEDTRTA